MHYNDENRGKIQNRKSGKIINDFSGLRFKNVTPTDIDGFIDFGDKKFVLLELKQKGVPLPYGQKLALERLCDSSKKDVVLIVADHTSNGEDIDVANCQVRESRYRGVWRSQFQSLTVLEAVIRFLNKS